MPACKTLGCENSTEQETDDFCELCLHIKEAISSMVIPDGQSPANDPQNPSPPALSCAEEDVYAVHHGFQIVDPSGALHHASRILLLCSLPENFFDQYAQVTQARDLLNRWLAINLLSTQ